MLWFKREKFIYPPGRGVVQEISCEVVFSNYVSYINRNRKLAVPMDQWIGFYKNNGYG